MTTMTDLFKQAFSRKRQVMSYLLLATGIYLMMPKESTWVEYTGQVMAWLAMLVFGVDSFDEGMGKGIAIASRLDNA